MGNLTLNEFLDKFMLMMLCLHPVCNFCLDKAGAICARFDVFECLFRLKARAFVLLRALTISEMREDCPLYVNCLIELTGTCVLKIGIIRHM
jgi:hypothetical protein